MPPELPFPLHSWLMIWIFLLQTFLLLYTCLLCWTKRRQMLPMRLPPGADHLNNLEQVVINNPLAGTYTANVAAFSIPQGPQRFVLVWSLEDDSIRLTYPTAGALVASGSFSPVTDSFRICWDAPQGPENFTLQYSLDEGR